MHTWAHTHQRRLEGLILRITSEKKKTYITYTHNCLSKMAFGPLLSFLLQGIVFSLLTRSGKKIWPQSLPLTLLICNTSAVGLRCVSYSYIRFLRVLWLSHFSLSRNPSMTWPWVFARFFSRTDHDAAHFQAGPSGSAADGLCLPLRKSLLVNICGACEATTKWVKFDVLFCLIYWTPILLKVCTRHA